MDKKYVCSRCISPVERLLTQMGLPVQELKLGEAVIILTETRLNYSQKNQFLLPEGLELIKTGINR